MTVHADLDRIRRKRRAREKNKRGQRMREQLENGIREGVIAVNDGRKQVIAALLCLNKDWSSEREIFGWITETVPGIGQMLKEYCLQHFLGTKEWGRTYYYFHEVRHPLAHVAETLDYYDLPIKRKLIGYRTLLETYETQYGIPCSSDAHAYVVGPPAIAKVETGSETCHFFALPGELRNRVYEAWLSLPTCVRVRCEKWRRLHTYSPKLEIIPTHAVQTVAPVSPGARSYYHLPRLSEFLRPLETCKQFYTEAMPLFYQNAFSFDMDSLSTALPSLPKSRAAHLTQLHLGLSTPSSKPGKLRSAIELLSCLEHLKKLDIQLDEHVCFLQDQGGSVDASNGLDDMRALAMIAARIQRTAISGDCPTFMAMVQDMQGSIQAKTDVAATSSAARLR